MKKIIKYLPLCFLLLGCNATKMEEDYTSKLLISTQPNLISNNWNDSLKPLINTLLKDFNNENSSNLFIAYPYNCTKQYLSTVNIHNDLNKLLSDQKIFSLIDVKKIHSAKQFLSIPYDESGVNQTQLLTLAKQLNAKYALFTYVYKVSQNDKNNAEITMELIDVESDEIVWHKKLTTVLNDNINIINDDNQNK